MIDVIFVKFLLFHFNFNVQLHAVPFNHIIFFQQDSKRGSVVEKCMGRGVGS